jgi:hypothetical protein
MCGLESLHQIRCIRIFTTLRSATSASSSTLVRERNPHVRPTRVRHRSFNFIALLIDRSWAFGFRVAINSLFLGLIPNTCYLYKVNGYVKHGERKSDEARRGRRE